MSADPRPVLAISMGDPLGIGPEVLVKALADPAVRRRCRCIVFGLHNPLLDAADAAGIEPFWWRIARSAPPPVAATTALHDVVLVDDDRLDADAFARRERTHAKDAGDASFQFVEDAIAATQRAAGSPLAADALVTAPISKSAWALAGHDDWPGHTELLASRFRAKRTAMMFVAPRLRVLLATSHIPLMTVASHLTIGKVLEKIELANEACAMLGIRAARIAVCGLNPHAGEDGILGDEDQRVIAPAIEHAREAGLDATGPHPADTVFERALAGKFDIVVAMYHDQGLIPVKTFFRDEAVNVTVGLPAVRTSPDHGTAFDIAGKNIADPRSMRCAVELAAAMSIDRPRPEPAARSGVQR